MITPAVYADLGKWHSGLRFPGERRLKPGETFVARFRHAWKRLPLAARRVILKWWRSHGGGVIELSTYDLDDNCSASCVAGRIIFRAINHDILDSDTVNTIAHELAHIHRFGTVGYDRDTQKCELEVRKLAESWGFPQPPWDPKLYRSNLQRDEELKAWVQQESKRTSRSCAS